MVARHKRSLVGLFGALATTLIAIGSCTPCATAPPCGGNDNGFFLSAHLQVSRQDLRGALARVCWRERCSEWNLPQDLERDLREDGSPRGDGFKGEVFGAQRLVLTMQGWLRIDFEAESLLDAPSLLQQHVANGDRYTFLVRRADGKVLLEVERLVDYILVRRANEECNDPACYVAFLELYPDTVSVQRCSGKRCFPIGVELPNALAMNLSTSAKTTLCRNDHCGRFPSDQPAIDPEAPRLESPLRRPDGITTEMRSEPAVLADGDRYRYFIEDNGRIVFDKTIVAKYDTSFPNGESCDRYACRTTVLDFR